MSEQARTVAERITAECIQVILACAEHGVGYDHARVALSGDIEAALTAYAAEIREAAAQDNAVLRAALTDCHIAVTDIVANALNTVDGIRC